MQSLGMCKVIANIPMMKYFGTLLGAGSRPALSQPGSYARDLDSLGGSNASIPTDAAALVESLRGQVARLKVGVGTGFTTLFLHFRS